MNSAVISNLKFQISNIALGWFALLLMAACFLPAGAAEAKKLELPPEAKEGLRVLYNGDPDAAIATFRKIQQAQPDHPLGYLLEANAAWWKLYCSACEIKWNMIDAFKRGKQPEDDAFLALADKSIGMAEARLAKSESAEMHLYAGLGLALKARVHALRDEKRATARTGVKAREHFFRAIEMDADLTDAYAGLGLYNYYVDTLSGLARILRFFMGIPGGSKKEGMRQLETAMNSGELTRVEARFYLAKNLRNYDQQYERAAALLEPLVAQYPQNPVFHLMLGNMNAKLNRNAQAAASYHAAQRITMRDSACNARLQQVASAALAILPPSAVNTVNSH